MRTPDPRSLLLAGGRVVAGDALVPADVLVREGRIAAVGPGLHRPGGPADPEVEVHDVQGRLVLAGGVDPQVHFREPGMEHKEDLESGSRAAAAGGVTSFFEMPNTKPPTTDPERLADKLARARGRAWADHAFFLGATAENADRLGEWETLPGCAGVKVFMGSSTGNLLVPDDATLERVLRSGRRRVAVHSEDEPRLRERYAAIAPGTSVEQHPDVRDVETAVRATTRLFDLVERTQRPIHLLHVSTAEEIALLRERDLGALVTAEVTPNHLFLVAPECYREQGARVQMNPPVRGRRHQEALRAALADGTVTCIGSDHAPHTLAEKAKPYPESPSGIPGVQTILPLLLLAVRDGWLSWSGLVRAFSAGAASVYGLCDKGLLQPGADADLVVVDLEAKGPLEERWLQSRAGYSPYAGWELAGLPERTFLRGREVWRGHAPVGTPIGAPVRFAL